MQGMDPQQALFFSRMEPCWGFVRYTLIFRLLKKKQNRPGAGSLPGGLRLVGSGPAAGKQRGAAGQQ